MKTKFNQTLFFILLLFSGSCSEERIQPFGVDDDFSISAQAHQSRFLLLEITTMKENESDQFPANMTFTLVALPGAKITVNWGDGTIEKRVMDETNSSFNHVYTRVKNFRIKVSGEIAKVTSFYLNYNDYLKLTGVQLAGLTNLTHCRIGSLAESPATIDLSGNPRLEVVFLFDLLQTTDIILPSTNNITSMVLIGDMGLSIPVLDRIIGRIYDSVVRTPRSGILNISKEPGTDSEILGPPSGYSINNLETLRDTYLWTIYPLSF